VTPKTEVTRAVVIEVREAAVVKMAETAAEKRVTAEAVTTGTMTAETTMGAEASAAVAAPAAPMSCGAGRHRCSTEHDGRCDRDQTHLPPHEVLSLLPSFDPSMAVVFGMLRIGDRRFDTRAPTLPVRISLLVPKMTTRPA
jgi:hypothetical protein